MSVHIPRSTDVSENRPIVVRLDATGEIIWVNHAWEEFGTQNGLPGTYQSVGKNYLEVTRRAQTESARHIVEGLTGVLDGARTTFTAIYPCHAPDKERWFHLYATATPVGDETGCLLIHRNITDRLPEGTVVPSASEPPARSTGPSNDTGRLVTYRIDSSETVVEATIEAFEAIPDFDIQDQTTVLNDWADVDAIGRLLEGAADCRVTTRVWGYHVVVTPEEIAIYEPP